MVEKRTNNFLGHDITIEKIDGKFVRGFCVNETKDGLLINPKNNYSYSDRFVFIPFSQIKEAFYEVEGGNK